MTLVLAPKDLANHSEFPALKNIFISYKSSGTLPGYLGKDVPYDRPDSAKKAGLQHIHLADNNQPWPDWVPQGARTSDKHLVYCEHYFCPGVFLFVAVLEPNAHDLANDSQIMITLSQIAEKFHATDCPTKSSA